MRHSLFAFPVIGGAASSRPSSPDIVSGLNLLEADAVLVGVVKPGLGRLESGGARVKGEAAAAHSGNAVGPTECRARRREHTGV